MISNYNVKANEVALVLKNGNIVRVEEQGKFWNITGQVLMYDKTLSFVPPIQLNIALQNQKLASMLEVVEVKDNEIVLLFINRNFKDVLVPGRYAFWKGIMEYGFLKADISNVNISNEIPVNLLDTPKLRPLVRKFTVATDESAILYINGNLERELSAGTYYFWANSTTIEIKGADLRLRFLEIAGQELLTKDKAALRINFFVQFKIIDVIKAIVNNKDYERQLYIVMQLALRESVGTLTLDELLSRKDSLGKEILDDVRNRALAMGIEVNDAGIRDVILPGDMKEIMNQVLIAEKKAQANSIMRREETASTRSLLNTAKLMEENAMLYKLKEMEYVEKIAEKINNISLSGSGQIVDQLKQIFVK